MNSLKEELQKLVYSYNSAKIKFQYDKNCRTYGSVAKLFGKKINNPILSSKRIWLNDIESIRETTQKIIEDTYACSRYLEFNVKREEIGKREINRVNNELQIQEGEFITGKIRRNDSNNKEEISKGLQKDDKSTFNPKYPDQKAILITDVCNQPLAAKTLWDNFTNKEFRGQLLNADAGIGKTYIIGSFLKNFIEQDYVRKLSCISPTPIWYITRSTVVTQTKNVLKNLFNIDTTNTVSVMNIEFLRTKLANKRYIKDVVKVKNGQDYLDYEWNELTMPCLIINDECQSFAREDALQTKLACAANNVSRNLIQIGVSATPFTRVCEAKHFTCSTKIQYEFGLDKEIITNDNWSRFSKLISDPDDPYMYSEEAIKRYIEFMKDYIVRVADIKLKYKSYISTNRLAFRNKQEREEFDSAWERYEREKVKIESDRSLNEGQSRFMLLAQFTIFRKAAEKIRRHHLAEFANTCWQNGEAPAIACAFKGTMVAVYKILVEDYNWKREDVSFIWGGATETLGKKAKLSKKIKESGIEDKLKALGVSLEDLGIGMTDYVEKTNEQYAFEKGHRLLIQKPEDREEERLRYQRQDSKLLIFSYKAGGVGLSAHHERDYPNARPRRGIFTPIYSEKEMAQAFKRLPRVTSISDTYSLVAYYGNTIEDAVIARLIMKLKCARHVGAANDSWEDIITGKSVNKEFEDELPDVDETIESNDNVVLLEEKL